MIKHFTAELTYVMIDSQLLGTVVFTVTSVLGFLLPGLGLLLGGLLGDLGFIIADLGLSLLGGILGILL